MDFELPATQSPLLVPGDGTVRRSSSSSSSQLCPPWRIAPMPEGEDHDLEVELVSNPHNEGEKLEVSDSDAESGNLSVVEEPRTLAWLASSSGQTWHARPGLTCYLVYCVVCLLLTGILLSVSIWECLVTKREARFWRRELRPWEEMTEAFVGGALFAETLAVLVTLGPQSILRDRWRLLDATIAVLTLICAAFFFSRRFIKGLRQGLVNVDAPMLAIRFTLQPWRIYITAKMVVRARRKRKRRKPDEVLEMVDPRRLEAMPSFQSALTPMLASQLRECLPGYLKFVDWHLAYAPRVHGTSLRTFFRQQAGPNVVVVRDAHGGIFGGFATESWRPQSGIAYGTGEAFVFVVRVAEGAAVAEGASLMSAEVSPSAASSGSSESSPVAAGHPTVFTDHCQVSERSTTVSFPASGHADADRHPANPSSGASKESHMQIFSATMQNGEVIQWGDSKMFGLGHAVVVQDDFLRGSSNRCVSFDTPSPLSSAGTDFIIRDFECWTLGAPHRGDVM